MQDSFEFLFIKIIDMQLLISIIMNKGLIRVQVYIISIKSSAQLFMLNENTQGAKKARPMRSSSYLTMSR